MAQSPLVPLLLIGGAGVALLLLTQKKTSSADPAVTPPVVKKTAPPAKADPVQCQGATRALADAYCAQLAAMATTDAAAIAAAKAKTLSLQKGWPTLCGPMPDLGRVTCQQTGPFYVEPQHHFTGPMSGAPGAFPVSNAAPVYQNQQLSGAPASSGYTTPTNYDNRATAPAMPVWSTDPVTREQPMRAWFASQGLAMGGSAAQALIANAGQCVSAFGVPLDCPAGVAAGTVLASPSSGPCYTAAGLPVNCQTGLPWTAGATHTI